MRARNIPRETFTELDTFTDCPEARARADKVIARLIAKYGQPFDYGRNRLVFANDRIVFKFPRNCDGEADNCWEGSCRGPTKARGKRLVIDGFICVMQERLQRIYQDVPRPKSVPKWTDAVDCMQIGYDRKGTLRVYDFGTR